MKKRMIVLAALLLMLPVWGQVFAQSDDVHFIMQKAKASVEKILSRSHETKPFTAAVLSAQNYLKKAESTLNANTNWRGNQEQENARLEKLIPETEGKIKVFDVKNKEIKLLREEIAKPKGDMKNISRELSALKLEKIDMTKEISSLKNEKANLTGQVSALNGVVVSLKNEVVDKTKKIDELSLSLAGKTGEDVVKTKNKLNSLNSFWQDVNQINVLSKLTATGITLIIPRRDLIKTPAMKLAPESEKMIGNIAGLMKKNPDIKAQMKVHGFGKPDKTENAKATEKMAAMIKDALIKAGVDAAKVDIAGAGTAAPLYSKSAVEDNKRVEIIFSGMIDKE